MGHGSSVRAAAAGPWLLISVAVHGVGIAAVFAFAAQTPTVVHRPPAQVAVQLRRASAAAALRVPPPAVVVEPLIEQQSLPAVLPEPPLPPLECALPVPPARDLLPAASPAATLQRATLDRVRAVAVAAAAELPPPVDPPTIEPSPVTVEPPAPALARVEARPFGDNPPPRYPERERRLGLEGRVVVRVLLDASGLVEQVSLSSASCHRAFDSEALRAVRRWRFEPALADGRPVASATDIEVLFRLQQ